MDDFDSAGGLQMVYIPYFVIPCHAIPHGPEAIMIQTELSR